MASESDVKLEIGHVLFIDAVGYSKLLIDDQRAFQEQLNQIVRNTAQFRAARPRIASPIRGSPGR